MKTDQEILSVHLFQDDFGEPGDFVLSDKMVNAAKEHTCVDCQGVIAKGERHRHHVGMYGGPRPFHYRYCSVCCDKMVEI